MLNYPALDVGIGLIFTYLVLALVCTAVNEALSGIYRSRAKTLYEGISRMLNPDGNTAQIAEAFFAHPLIKSLRPEKNGIFAKFRDRSGRKAKPGDITPSYIPPRIFAAVLDDILAEAPPAGGKEGRADIHKIAEKLKSGKLAATESSTPQQNVEQWFNDAMERVSGRYKWKTQRMSLWVALAVTIVANADSLQMADRLWTNPLLRAAVLEEAKIRAQKPAPVELEYPNPDDPVPSEPIETGSNGTAISEAEMKLVGQLTGWNIDGEELRRRCTEQKCGDKWYQGAGVKLGWFGDVLFQHMFGWALTAMAVSLGAPFWFDVLNKFIRVRSVGASPADKQKEQAKLEAAKKRKEDTDA